MRGFSYLWVLLLSALLLSILGTATTITIREVQKTHLDQQRLQAWAYAESGITYYQNIHPTLPYTQALTDGRFEITQKQGIIYSTGYCQKAIQTIELKGSTQCLAYGN